MQTLKAANSQRVDTRRAAEMYSGTRMLGSPDMCPASAQELQHDVFGRPASQQTLRVNLDAACAQGSQFPAERQIAIESYNRPYVPICAAGERGAGDFMGVSRDNNPQNLYGSGYSGNFVRHYDTPNNAPWDTPDPRAGAYQAPPSSMPLNFQSCPPNRTMRQDVRR